ncbi:carbohydrate binding domain-containing protein [Streptomyces sp. NPDC003233]
MGGVVVGLGFGRAKNAGIRIDVVNIMAMDYYAGTGTEMGQGAIDAARATLAQMQSVDSGYTYANLGITPMIGKNDDGSTFTLGDARTVENFAAQNGVGRLAFWSVNRDQPCGGSANSLPTCSEISQNSLAFTDAFVPYEGSSGGGGGTTSDFSLSLSPGSASVAQGGSATATVATAVTSGSAESVSLSASGAPSGVSISFSPASVTSGGTSTLTATAGSSVATGTYPITVTGSAAGGSHSATYTLTVTSSGGGGGGGGGSLTNAGFETGSLSPWTCTGGSTVVTGPVHSGSHALQVTPSSSSTGECDQTVTLSPNHGYTLTDWVQGPYAYVGVSGGASASTWSSNTSWNQLTVNFTTGSSGTVTVYVHGWYGQGNVYADDFTLG